MQHSGGLVRNHTHEVGMHYRHSLILLLRELWSRLLFTQKNAGVTTYSACKEQLPLLSAWLHIQVHVVTYLINRKESSLIPTSLIRTESFCQRYLMLRFDSGSYQLYTFSNDLMRLSFVTFHPLLQVPQGYCIFFLFSPRCIGLVKLLT